MLQGCAGAGSVINFSCPHPHFPLPFTPHFPPFFPISPHFPPFFLGHVAQYTPPQPPRAREKWFFGVLVNRYPHFSTKNLQILTVGPIFPHFSYLEQFSGGIPSHFRQRVIRGPWEPT